MIYISVSRTASEWCVRSGGIAAQHGVQCPTGRFVHTSKRGAGVCPHPTSMVCHKLWDALEYTLQMFPAGKAAFFANPG